MDFGYPQNCSVDVLKMYINLGSVQPENEEAGNAAHLTSQITGAIDWRREGIRYRKNEVFIDVLESVNLVVSANGENAGSLSAWPLSKRSFAHSVACCCVGVEKARCCEATCLGK
jgi:hypothetical protein